MTRATPRSDWLRKARLITPSLLHDLYHLKPNGIMAIVLPHGVLFRGGEEGNIRKNLIEENHIDAIIGLPCQYFSEQEFPPHHHGFETEKEKTRMFSLLMHPRASPSRERTTSFGLCDIKRVWWILSYSEPLWINSPVSSVARKFAEKNTI